MDNPPHFDEKDLLSQLYAGSEQAFEKIYKQYSQRLFAGLVKLVKSEAEAQEMLQDVFVKIWDNRQKIDPARPLLPYLLKIAENKAIDYFRKVARDRKKRDQLIAMATTEDSGSFEVTDHSEQYIALLNKAIESLPLQRQRVFRLCKLEGKSYQEINQLLGISVSTISDHIVKANKAIREYFANNEQAFAALFLLTCWGLQ